MPDTSTRTPPFLDIKNLDKDAVKFIFESGEKRLKHLLEVSDRTTNRAFTILSGLIPLVAFLLSVLYKHYFGGAAGLLAAELFWLSWLSLVAALAAMILLTLIVFPRSMHQLGREPKKLLTVDLLQHEYYTDSYKLLLYIESEELQGRIDYMQRQSNRRVRLFKAALMIIAGYALLCFAAIALWAVSR